MGATVQFRAANGSCSNPKGSAYRTNASRCSCIRTLYGSSERSSRSALFGNEHDLDDDPFLSIETKTAITGMPILPESRLWLDCKLEGHLSPDADCRLYLGQVVAAHIELPKRGSKKDDLIQTPLHDRRKSPRSTPAISNTTS